MKFTFNRYILALFITSISFMIIGFATGKISTDSFSYLSITGLLNTILQMLIVVMVLIVGLIMTIPAFIGDLILLFVTLSFPLLSSTWRIIWNQVTIDWFWATSSGSSLFYACVVVSLCSFLFIRK